ncbi:hypothetical protein B0T13DRAFT_143571 [Neurospora crassa]|nr:hypothetical protein B0T13DRAFT_143571 [Neurospora crassa]
MSQQYSSNQPRDQERGVDYKSTTRRTLSFLSSFQLLFYDLYSLPIVPCKASATDLLIYPPNIPPSRRRKKLNCRRLARAWSDIIAQGIQHHQSNYESSFNKTILQQDIIFTLTPAQSVAMSDSTVPFPSPSLLAPKALEPRLPQPSLSFSDIFRRHVPQHLQIRLQRRPPAQRPPSRSSTANAILPHPKRRRTTSAHSATAADQHNELISLFKLGR